MLSVLLCWCFIFITTFIPGFLILSLAGGKENPFSVSDASFAGLMCVTVYAQLCSIFGGVGAGCDILLVLLCALICLLRFRELKEYVKDRKPGRLVVVCAPLLVLLMAYGTSRGYFHFDSDLYHGQAIRWIEEYGMVKGLGNLDGRLAYNSASFALSALYSFHFITGQSFHAVAGYMALLLAFKAARVFSIFRDRSFALSDFIRMAALYYLFDIYDEMVSPASDYFTMLLFYYVILRMMEIYEEQGSREPGAYIVPALLAVFSVTLKLSAAAVVAVVLIPLCMLVKKKRYLSILSCAAACVIVVLPWLIRAYFLSGRLFYPSLAFDIFDPVWKVPKSLTAGDSAFIVAYGKGFTIAEAAGYGVAQWFPVWWAQLSAMDKLFFMSSAAGVLVLAAALFLRKKEYIPHLLEITVLLAILFWFFVSPLIRYGRAFFILFPFMMAGEAAMYIKEKLPRIRPFVWPALCCFLALLMLYKTYGLGRTVVRFASQPYYIKQQDYGEFACEELKLDGMSVWLPVDDNRRGYAAFPSAPYLPEGLHALGDGAAEGFYIEE